LLPQVQPAAGQRVWHQTVDALPSSWFAAEHSAVLVSYCNHVTRAAQIEAALANLDPLADLNEFDKLSKLAAGESAKIAMHARQSVFEYIGHYYNQIRRHSNNGWTTPVEFERLNQQSLEGSCVY
jgi:transposase InsO family protein